MKNPFVQLAILNNNQDLHRSKEAISIAQTFLQTQLHKTFDVNETYRTKFIFNRKSETVNLLDSILSHSSIDSDYNLIIELVNHGFKVSSGEHPLFYHLSYETKSQDTLHKIFNIINLTVDKKKAKDFIEKQHLISDLVQNDSIHTPTVIQYLLNTFQPKLTFTDKYGKQAIHYCANSNNFITLFSAMDGTSKEPSYTNNLLKHINISMPINEVNKTYSWLKDNNYLNSHDLFQANKEKIHKLIYQNLNQNIFTQQLKDIPKDQIHLFADEDDNTPLLLSLIKSHQNNGLYKKSLLFLNEESLTIKNKNNLTPMSFLLSIQQNNIVNYKKVHNYIKDLFTTSKEIAQASKNVKYSAFLDAFALSSSNNFNLKLPSIIYFSQDRNIINNLSNFNFSKSFIDKWAYKSSVIEKNIEPYSVVDFYVNAFFEECLNKNINQNKVLTMCYNALNITINANNEPNDALYYFNNNYSFYSKIDKNLNLIYSEIDSVSFKDKYCKYIINIINKQYNQDLQKENTSNIPVITVLNLIKANNKYFYQINQNIIIKAAEKNDELQSILDYHTIKNKIEQKNQTKLRINKL